MWGCGLPVVAMVLPPLLLLWGSHGNVMQGVLTSQPSSIYYLLWRERGESPSPQLRALWGGPLPCPFIVPQVCLSIHSSPALGCPPGLQNAAGSGGQLAKGNSPGRLWWGAWPGLPPWWGLDAWVLASAVGTGG